MFLIMAQPTSLIPIRITFIAGILIVVLVLFVNIVGQSPADPIATSSEGFRWVIDASAFIALACGIIYGFIKKQRSDEVEKSRNDWKELAESREERIVELNEKHSLQKANLELTIRTKDAKIQNLDVSNEALVSQSMQMKAILKQLRLAGKWEGHEDNLHATEG